MAARGDRSSLKKSHHPSNATQTIQKALTVLEYMIEAKQPVRLSELGKGLGWNKSTVHRILQALLAKDYLYQNDDSSYCVGYKILELSNRLVRKIDLRQAALSQMSKLAATSHETVGLAKMERRGVIYLDQIGGEDEGVRIHFRMGVPLPFHCTGTGKAMLAFMSEAEFESIMAQQKLTRYTHQTITSIKELREQCRQIQNDGYAFNDREWQEMVRVVGAPIFNANGKVIGSVCVAALSHRLSPDQVPGVGAQVIEAGNHISRNFGWLTESSGIRSIR